MDVQYLRNRTNGRAWSPTVPGRHWRHYTTAGILPKGRAVGQQNIHELDRRAALLAAFDGMTDEAQGFALRTMRALEEDYPRRPSLGLRLVARNGNTLNLLSAPGGA